MIIDSSLVLGASTYEGIKLVGVTGYCVVFFVFVFLFLVCYKLFCQIRFRLKICETCVNSVLQSGLSELQKVSLCNCFLVCVRVCVCVCVFVCVCLVVSIFTGAEYFNREKRK